jgi:putative ABC transport system permease protein
MRLLEIFMVLSLIISLLGLVAMSTYYADERASSIAVRKVFGGTVDSELWRSVRDYMAMVGVACVIGLPVSVWAAAKYLEGFTVKLEHYGWIFVLAAALSVVFAFGSVLWQTLKAAKTDPAVALKKE